MTFSIALDLFPLLAAVLAALTCGLLGNFLVLRRLSLMGDAISHSVLPGLVIAFLVTSSRSPLIMLAGAAIAGVATVVLVELVKRLGRVEPGAAMGVVFSVLFALGVLLIEQAAARHVDLDASCVLYGQLETLIWYDAPTDFADLLTPATLDATPRQVTTLAATLAIAVALVTLLFKELRIAAFDPDLATTQGYGATLLHYILMVVVAAATVASFEAVGSILVIAMLVGPAATARLLTDRLAPQIFTSAIVALATALLGYFAATAVPAAFDKDSVSAAGSMAVAAGLLLAAAIVASPRHGLIARALRQRALARTVALEDLLGTLFRAAETGAPALAITDLRVALTPARLQAALAPATRAALITRDADTLRLTEAGHAAARDLIRRHRLWEHYLVDRVGLSPDHVHTTAESLEHLALRPADAPATDPPGRPTPRDNAPRS
ncbi:MAG: metal ABC transporter permease [Phycisphaerales bacterium]